MRVSRFRTHLFVTRACGAAVGTLVLFAAHVSLAQSAPSQLTSLFPPACQAGERVEVTAAGKNLDGATALHFSVPGIEAKALPGSGGGARFEVRAGRDVPPGVYEARVVGRSGISNARAFLIGRDEESASPVDNTSIEKAAELPSGRAVCGRCAAGAAQYFALPLRGGESVLLECATEAVDSKLVPAMRLFDGRGGEVARARGDGVLSFRAAADGRYVLELHDLMYRGGAEYFYHVSASGRPHVDHVFPPVGRAGTTSVYTLYGRNLPGGRPSDWRAADGVPLERADVEISLPGRMPEGGFAYRLKGEAGDSNPVVIFESGAPVVTDGSGKLPFPTTVAGLLRDGEGRYEMQAVKGQKYSVEILCDRLGGPSAPQVVVQSASKSAKGDWEHRDLRDVNGIDAAPEARLAWRGAGSRDFTFGFEANVTGPMRLLVRDLVHGGGGGGTTPFALFVREPEPDFTLVASPAVVAKNNGRDMQASSGIVLRRGETFPVELTLFRRDGFGGAVGVECEGLPEGVAGRGSFGGDFAQGVLFLRADENAAAWAGPVKIVAAADVGGRERRHEAQYQMVVWGSNEADAPVRRPVGDFAVATSDEVCPLSIEVAEKAATPLRPQGARKLSVPLKLTRRALLKSGLTIRARGLPQLSALADLTLAPTSDEATLEVDLGGQRLRPGAYTIYLEAEGQFQFPEPPATMPAGAAAAKKPAPAAFQSVVYSGPIRFEVK